MSTQSQVPLRVVVVVLVAVSAPLALGLETSLRKLVVAPLIGAELEEIRAYYLPAWTLEARRAVLTKVAWVLVGVSVLAGLLGVGLQRRASERGIAAAREHADPHGLQEWAQNHVRDQLLLLTSVPQVPAILATLCFTFGSLLLPVLLSMVISTAFVLAQGFIGERLLQQAADLV